MRLPAYPSYKASGIEWLGDLPKHWDVKRLKTAAAYWVSNVDKVPSEGEIPVRLCNYTDVYYNDHIDPDMDLMETTATEDEIRRFGLRTGDILLTKDSEEWSDIAIPALVTDTAPDLVCGYHLAILRAPAEVLDARFLFRVFQSSAVNQQFQLAASGVTRFGLPKRAIGDALVLLPPLPEQRAIADFLDSQTAKIDTLVAKKRELIEKLKEKRAALISRTIFRGLPPEAAHAHGLETHPRLKPSGAEWLGDVPEHWNIGKFSREVRIAEGQVDPEDELFASMPLVAPNHVESSTGRALGEESAEDQGAISGKYLCRAGDVVYSKIRPALAKAVLARQACLCSADMYPLTVGNRLVNRYLLWLLLSPEFTAWSVLESDRVAMPKINRDTLTQLRMPIPPRSEQLAIAGFLDCEAEKIHRLVAIAEAAIERLQEYRTALISAAVTGKVDIRGAVGNADTTVPEAAA